MDSSALQAELAHFGHRIGWALLASAALALGAWKVRSLTIGGAVASTLMGAAIFSLGGFQAWLMYLAAATVAITSWRVGQKRRGPTLAVHGVGSAVASCAVGVIGAFLMAAIDADAAGALILTTGVAAWASQAVASEFEKGYGKGAVAIASLITSIIIAGQSALLFPGTLPLAPFIVLGTAAGSIATGALGKRYKDTGVLNEDGLLFVHTFVAAAIACVGLLAAVTLRNRLG